MNYFEFYELPISFELDESELRRKFLTLSKKYHPDFYTLESDEKQAEILERSTVNNEAYKALKDKEKRIKYILELKGLLGDNIKPQLPQAFLLEMMDINEQVMELQFDYNETAHQNISKEINKKEAELWEEAKDALKNYKDETPEPELLDVILNYYLKNRYLLRLNENIQRLVTGEAPSLD